MPSLNFLCTPESFAEEWQGHRPFLMKGVGLQARFSWGDVNEIIDRCDARADDFKISLDGIRPKREYVESYVDVGMPKCRLIKPVVYDYLRRGATLTANKIQDEPLVRGLSREVAQFTGRRVVTSMYLAFGEKDSFRCHWDTRDVFAIQLIGRKRWIVYEPSFEAPLYTQQSKDIEDRYPCPPEPCMDFVLEPGDVFYLPRGWWHNPLPLGEPTVHLAIGTFPAYGMDYLGWTMNRMQDVVAARQSLAGGERDQELIEEMARQFRSLLVDSANYRRFTDEFIGSTRVPSSLAFDLLGDPHAGVLPDDIGLRLCVDQVHGLDDGYLIANGVRLNLDASGVDMVRHIARQPGIRIDALVAHCPAMDAAKLRSLLTDLCRQDVLEPVRPGS